MEYTDIILLLVVSFLPPILYTIWIRNTEKYNRERWISIFLCFLWGATISVIAAFIIEVLLDISLIPNIENDKLGLIVVILIAPFAEEFTKPLALSIKRVRNELEEFEDGLIYGAVAGLGFSATENLLYGYSFGLDCLSESLVYFLVFMAIRSFGGCLLHASATAWTGYGYAKVIIGNKLLIRVLPYFLFAVFIHAMYNSLLTFEILGAAFGLFAALLLASFSIIYVRKKIRTLESQQQVSDSSNL